jgi:probable F420-dependent oxidoreductase
MRVGVGITCGGDVWPLDRIRLVEELGFDSFWTGEHIVYHRPILDAVPILSMAAAVTRRIRIGPATLLLPLRHPTLVAKEFSTLDVLSNGRVILTVGVGGDYPREFQACSVPMEERGRRTNEALEIIKRYWAGGRFDYEGEIFTLKDTDMLPLPVQPGGPPIWVSGRSEAAMRRAARLGDGFHPYMYTPAHCREAFPRVKAMAREMGRALPDDYVFAIFQYVSLGDDEAEARARGVKELTYRYDQDFSRLVDRYCVYGPPARVVEGLRAYVDAGCSYLILAPIMTPGRQDEELSRYATDVLPALRRMTAPAVALAS